jgi:hypothetical protein
MARSPTIIRLQKTLKEGLRRCVYRRWEATVKGAVLITKTTELERFKADRGLKLNQEHQVLAFSQAPRDADYLGFLNTLRIRTLVAQAEAITPLGDLTDFAELAG